MLRVKKRGTKFEGKFFKGEKEIGRLEGVVSGSYLEIHKVEIHPEHRGKGHFNELILEVINEMKPHTLVFLEVRNPLLQKWAEEKGFQKKQNRYVHYEPEKLVKSIKKRIREKESKKIN